VRPGRLRIGGLLRRVGTRVGRRVAMGHLLGAGVGGAELAHVERPVADVAALDRGRAPRRRGSRWSTGRRGSTSRCRTRTGRPSRRGAGPRGCSGVDRLGLEDVLGDPLLDRDQLGRRSIFTQPSACCSRPVPQLVDFSVSNIRNGGIPNQRQTSVIWKRRDSRGTGRPPAGSSAAGTWRPCRARSSRARCRARSSWPSSAVERVGLRWVRRCSVCRMPVASEPLPEQLGAVLLGGQAEADRLAGDPDRGDAADPVVPEAGRCRIWSSPTWTSRPPSIE
jgi:hypothetical protein